MKEIIADAGLVAFCGLYCGACGSYLKGRCPGCHQHEGAAWCKVRVCCIEARYPSCADCATFPDPKDCRKFNNMFSKTFGFIFRSDRRACIMQIREKGLLAHAENMALRKSHTIKRS